MKNILIIDNFDSFTFNLADFIGQLGYNVQVYRNTIDPAEIPRLKPDCVVFSPGPSVPKNAGNMMKIIELYHKDYPMLGVCLGHEAFVEFFGGSLKFVEPIHGESSPIHHDGRTIFADLPQNFAGGRYHSLAADKVPDCFEVSAKHGAERSANDKVHGASAEGREECSISLHHGDIVMAIRHKNLPIEGVQFHPESVLTMKNQAGMKLLQNFFDTHLNRPAFQMHEKNSSITAGKMPGFGSREVKSQGQEVVPGDNFFQEKFPIEKLSLTQFLQKSITSELSESHQLSYLATKNDFTAQELVDAVNFLHSQMPISVNLPGAIDICGTGGSGLPRINTSTISAFILASLGVKIAKHGNKASAGRFGSFDLLESLGINFDQQPKQIESLYAAQNLAFLYARNFHPVLVQFAEVRKKIGQPTFFNLLGPLLSPAKVERQIIGTTFRDKMALLAETCKLLDKKHVYVVCGEDGLDEVTITGKTYVTELNNGKIKNYELTPKDFGIKPALPSEICTKCEPSEMPISTSDQNTQIALSILNGSCITRHLDLVLVNSALALKLTGKTKTLEDGYKLAAQSITSHMAFNKFNEYKTLSSTQPGPAPIPSVLLKIVENKAQELSVRKKKLSLSQLKKLVKPSTRDFRQALLKTKSKPALIAEIKKKSPSKHEAQRSNFVAKISVPHLAQLYETSGANAISVLCDQKFFGGGLKDLQTAALATQKIPLLCKDFIIDEYQIYEARCHGADAILLIASLLSTDQIAHFLEIAYSLKMAAICEVHTFDELQRVLSTKAQIVGINNRDLHTFNIDLQNTNQLVDHIPKDKIIISESGISARADVEKLSLRVNAILVGTSIVESEDPRAKIKELIAAPHSEVSAQKLIKLCGIRKLKDAISCGKLGVDFIGLNFVPTSKRKIDFAEAEKICQQPSIKCKSKSSGTKIVGIFKDQPLVEVNKIAKKLNLDFIQLSGQELLAYVSQCAKPVIKTISLNSEKDFQTAAKFAEKSAYILFDGPSPGSGKTFDEKLFQSTNSKTVSALEKLCGKFFIAGGLNSKNLCNQLKTTHALGADLASGIETNGEVDQKKIQEIIKLLKSC